MSLGIGKCCPWQNMPLTLGCGCPKAMGRCSHTLGIGWPEANSRRFYQDVGLATGQRIALRRHRLAGIRGCMGGLVVLDGTGNDWHVGGMHTPGKRQKRRLKIWCRRRGCDMLIHWKKTAFSGHRLVQESRPSSLQQEEKFKMKSWLEDFVMKCSADIIFNLKPLFLSSVTISEDTTFLLCFFSSCFFAPITFFFP